MKSKSPSIKDVAADSGVSVGTVSNVLNHPERVSESTIKRVTKSISELGFVRNDAARQLRAGASRTIGLMVFDATNPFFTDLARGAEEAASRLGFSVILANAAESEERELKYLDLFEEQRVRGILVSPYGQVEKRLLALKEFGIPSVLVDQVSEDGGLSSVSVNDVAGGEIAANHLLERGHRSIAFVGGPLEIPQVAGRLQGAQQAVSRTQDARLEVFATNGTTVLEGRRLGNQICEMDVSLRPTGIFAANDLVAIGLLQAIVVTGRHRVPEDIAVVGYDDIDFATSAIVPLTSIRQPSSLIGQTAVEILTAEAIDPSREPQAVVFQPELVSRLST